MLEPTHAISAPLTQLITRGNQETSSRLGDAVTAFAECTSVAAPVGADVSAMMPEQLDTLDETITAAGMKALLVQTEIDLTANHYRRAVGEAAETFDGPDFATGWADKR